MYLRALEIHGFKSFPQKIRLNFEKPVVGIVGPNGSGKSNISDAVLWVMGEQSTKTLRGGKMEDVIFGGTETRSPMGFAEVSLVLDNSEKILDADSDEVTVTRRYYRSGESEYYINRQAVRLKDVNELFMDTGLGRDGYGIIGQGRIDAILSAKSTDRREIFEEAAGISRFRYRKEESERKLARAEENLLRVNDKIAELEMQVEPLREQSEVAKKYLVLRDELRGLDISLWCDGLKKAAEREQKSGADLEIANTDLNRANGELEALYAAGEEFSRQLREKDIEAESVRSEISAKESRISELDSSAAVLKANLEGNAENIQRLGRDIESQDAQNSGILKQMQERRDRMAAIDGETTEIAGKIKELSDETEKLAQEASGEEGELYKLTCRETANGEETAALKAKITAVAGQIQEYEDRSTSLIKSSAEASEKLEELKISEKSCAEKLKAAEEKALSLNNVIGGYRLRLEARKKKAESAKEKRDTLNRELSSLKDRRNLLQEMEREYEGYSRAVKAVMQEASRGVLRNIRGPVADLIKTEERYSVAVETALGPAMQNIVVDTEEDAKAAIGLLKRREIGRATFLPVSAIKGRELSERGLENEDGFVGLAIELVSFDKKYKEIYSNLLGRTVVSDNLDCAVKTARKYGHRFRIVTLDGQVINAGGSMTGGAASKSAGILSRANELQRLVKKEEMLSSDAVDAEKACAEAMRESDAAEYELGAAMEELRPVEDDILKLRGDLGHYGLLIEAAEASAENTREECLRLEEKTNSAEKEVEKARESLAALETELAEIRAGITEKTAGAQDIEDKRRALRDRTEDLRRQTASLEAEKAAAEASLKELEELSGSIAAGRDRAKEVMDGMKADALSIEAGILNCEKEAEEVRAEAEILRSRLSEITNEKLSLEAERSKRERETQDKNRQILELERESARLSQNLAAAQMEEKQLIDKLWDTYELSRSAAFAQAAPLESVPAAQKRAGELKREMGRLGTPNLGAIEEYERVNTRYTYLTEQRDDIEKAKKELNGIIGDITREMKDIFRKGFEDINESFRQTFTELFGGGRASLELEDPEDILGCGIDIKVQPPGKMLKTLTLLSGGEKAFVAIALYFAILKIRPTPFVIMDEIEAALDDANIVRFSEYLRRMSDNTQFLVITHRRRTMEEADVLYGVTMQEKGVSQVIHVDLEEAEKTLAN